MFLWRAVVLSALLAVSCWAEDLTFPPGFKFGAATASYQVEGAWNEGDKSESTWDRYTHEDPTRVADQSNGDVACDSYHQWKRDIEMAEELGLHFYRFSLSWTRFLPNGFANYISEDGRNYYNNLIDGLLEKGIEPMVTLFHWDLPQSLQDLGGWANPLIVDWFADYARVVYTLFGDRVKWWLTINEPLVVCDGVYAAAIVAPGILSKENGVFLCNKHALLAHAKAWRIYDEEFKQKYQDSPKTKLKSIRIMAGRYSHAIYSKEGGWPPSIEKHFEELSLKKGYSKSMLPAFTPEEIEYIKGTYDYYAMNHYTTRLIRKAEEGEEFTDWPLGDAEDLNAIVKKGDDWPQGASSWFYVYPEGIRRQLVWLKKNYGDMEYVITENGHSSFAGLEDIDRIKYYRDYMKQIVWLMNKNNMMLAKAFDLALHTVNSQMLLAMKEDGVNVTRYTAWTLMDNFEWMDGYNVKFGLYEVNFNDPLRTRTPRDSAHYYARIIKSNSLDVPTMRVEL